MKMVVAVDENWGIGYEGKLLTKIPQDMKRFRSVTADKTVIVGRVTLNEFPSGKPLPYHESTIVMTSNPEYNQSGVIIARSIEECIMRARQYNDNDIVVVGGGAIYNQFLKYCDTAYVTKIYNKFRADTWFPNLDEKGWKITYKSALFGHNDIEYQFFTYER